MKSGVAPVAGAAISRSLRSAWGQVAARSGMAQLDEMKSSVERHEKAYRAAVASHKLAKEAHDGAVGAHSARQRELASLLQRQSAWTGEDVVQFTAATHREFECRAAATAAMQSRDEADAASSAAQHAYMRAVRER